MRSFENFKTFNAWFSVRYFEDEVAYLKGVDQQILFMTTAAAGLLKLCCHESLAKKCSNIEDLIKLDHRLITEEYDALVMENILPESNEFLYWVKRRIAIQGSIYLLVEKTVGRNLSVNNIIKTRDSSFESTVRETVRDSVPVKFSTRESEILYLLASDVPVAEIAKIFCVEESTIRTHINRKIMTKFETMGFICANREDVVMLAKQLGWQNKLPKPLMKRMPQIMLIGKL